MIWGVEIPHIHLMDEDLNQTKSTYQLTHAMQGAARTGFASKHKIVYFGKREKNLNSSWLLCIPRAPTDLYSWRDPTPPNKAQTPIKTAGWWLGSRFIYMFLKDVLPQFSWKKHPVGAWLCFFFNATEAFAKVPWVGDWIHWKIRRSYGILGKVCLRWFFLLGGDLLWVVQNHYFFWKELEFPSNEFNFKEILFGKL